MIEVFLSGGLMMWPLTAVALGVVALAVRTALRLQRPSAIEEMRAGLDAILFWGGMGLLLGFLATVVGLVVMARAIAAHGPVGAPLLRDGVGVSLVTSMFGLLIFAFASVLWLGLDRLMPRGG